MSITIRTMGIGVTSLLAALLSLPFSSGAIAKTTSWELCTEPWLADSGLFNTTITTVLATGYDPDQSSNVVVKLFPCPYAVGATQAGLWTQTCNYNIYSKAYEAKRPSTTCVNELAVFGAATTAGKPSLPATISWQSDVLVTYDPAAARRELQAEPDGGHAERALARSNPNDWWSPVKHTYSNTRWIEGTGKLAKPYGILQAINLQSSSKLDARKLEFTWNVNIAVTYKKPYYGYNQLG